MAHITDRCLAGAAERDLERACLVNHPIYCTYPRGICRSRCVFFSLWCLWAKIQTQARTIFRAPPPESVPERLTNKHHHSPVAFIDPAQAAGAADGALVHNLWGGCTIDDGGEKTQQRWTEEKNIHATKSNRCPEPLRRAARVNAICDAGAYGEHIWMHEHAWAHGWTHCTVHIVLYIVRGARSFMMRFFCRIRSKFSEFCARRSNMPFEHWNNQMKWWQHFWHECKIYCEADGNI